MLGRVENRRLWSYEDSLDRAHLEMTLVLLLKELATRLKAISQGVSPVHRATAEWLRQLNARVAKLVTEAEPLHAQPADLNGGVKAGRVGGRAVAHQIGMLAEVVWPMVKTDYVSPEERVRLKQLLAQIRRLAYGLNGRTESPDASGERANHNGPTALDVLPISQAYLT